MNLGSAVLAGLAFAAVLGCDRRSFDPFPHGQEAPEWTRGRVRVFEAGRLWEYVDGDAERYLQAGVERTFTAQYRFRQKADAVVDVHQMRDPAGARTIFESESEAGSRPVAVGEAGRFYGMSLTFRRGRYFVRLTTYEDSPQMHEALIALAAAVDNRVRQAPP